MKEETPLKTRHLWPGCPHRVALPLKELNKYLLAIMTGYGGIMSTFLPRMGETVQLLRGMRETGNGRERVSFQAS